MTVVRKNGELKVKSKMPSVLVAAIVATVATAADPANLQSGQAFTLQLAEPVKALAVRVLGVPACGDYPKQIFSLCSELQAYAQ